ncbi:uncharacterized protein LDX57_000199 [Aspergillus melleus]|uniref:uncharacterized protein n=1 Tax=Aspergillus melleus TaxID=138277 RepID=UPI001E8D9BA6|nr:uncharacterized protein LDX57_000199 [Aspergillus melleus]KAH8422444.1 hypothetical protein LDX57_000199 [Aspergillus melleus]
MEATGAASAILGIATTGAQCSIKLLTFAGHVKSAEEEITHLAEDVSLNASILQQLGDLVKDGEGNEQARFGGSNDGHDERESLVADIHDARYDESKKGIFNAVGLATVMKLAERCRAIFDTLDEAIQRATAQSGSTSRTPGQVTLGRLAMLRWPLLRPETEAVRCQLRDIIGTLMFMLQLGMLRCLRRMAEGGPNKHACSFSRLSKADQELLVMSIITTYQKQQAAIRPSSEDTRVNDTPSSVIELNGLRPGRETRANNQHSVKNKPSRLFGFCRRLFHPTSNEMAADQASDKSNSGQNSVRDTPLESSYSSEGSHVRPLQVEEQSFASPPEAQSCADYQDGTIAFINEAKANVQYLSSPEKEPVRSEFQQQTEILPQKDCLEVRVFSPVACVKDRKIHIEYIHRVIHISQEAAQWQLEAWRSTSTDTVLSRLLALTTCEHEALKSQPFAANDNSNFDYKTLEWLHLGDTLPLIDDVAHVWARSITAVVKVSRESQGKRRDVGQGEREQGERVDTWTKVPRQYLHPETLNHYNLPWMEDEHDSDCVLVKRFISQALQEELFAHTRRVHREPLGVLCPWQKAEKVVKSKRKQKSSNSEDTGIGPTSNPDIISQSNINIRGNVENIVDELLARYTNA